LPPWIGTAATAVLVGILVGLVVFASWIGIQTSAASEAAQQAASINDSYQDGRFAVAEEEALLLEYRQSPDPNLRMEHRQASEALTADLVAISLLGPNDHATIAQLSTAHGKYLNFSMRMFDAVDAGNLATADSIAHLEIAPVFAEIEDVINRESVQHHSESVAAFRQQLLLTTTISRIAPAIIALALILIGFLTLVLQVNRRARDAKSFFLARVSHELRTPLNSILGFSQLFLLTEGADLNEKQRRYLNNIQSSGVHLLDLINDVLDMSKAESGKMVLELAPVSVDEVIIGALEEVGPLIDAKKLILLPLAGVRGLTMSADRMRLRQVLLNGLSNAVKFTDEGGAITLATRTTKDSVWIDIADTGRGIPGDQLTRMFEEFEQLDNTRSRRGEGTGIGLPLSKALVEMMGGRLTLTSRVGVGTTFHIRLPRASSSSPASNILGPADPAGIASKSAVVAIQIESLPA
jgi:signal transduction histidine kinase